MVALSKNMNFEPIDAKFTYSYGPEKDVVPFVAAEDYMVYKFQ